jgi:hypothetical protein
VNEEQKNIRDDRSTPRLEIPGCIVWLGFLWAILLIIIVCWSVGRAWRIVATRVLHLRPHVWRKRGIGKELHLVSNADAATQQNKLSLNLNIVVMTRCRDSSLPRRPAVHSLYHLHATDTGVRRTLRDDFSIFIARAITHRTPRKAELFCEICMRGQAAVMIASSTMDAYYCWLFLESLMQLEGELRKTQICRSPFF